MFVTLAIVFANATIYKMILILGSFFDVNEIQAYHLSKESAAFDMSYADIFIISVLVYFLVFAMFFAFELIMLMLKLLLVNSYTR